MAYNEGAERLKRMVERDGSSGIERTIAVFRSDLYAVIAEFFDVGKLEIKLSPTDNGKFVLDMKASVSCVYEVGKTTVDA